MRFSPTALLGIGIGLKVFWQEGKLSSVRFMDLLPSLLTSLLLISLPENWQ
jgi:hypothetical protein